ncbi:MAG: hypothetical protein ACRC1K_15890, partial [Planctomycetia bacterium]
MLIASLAAVFLSADPNIASFDADPTPDSPRPPAASAAPAVGEGVKPRPATSWRPLFRVEPKASESSAVPAPPPEASGDAPTDAEPAGRDAESRRFLQRFGDALPDVWWDFGPLDHLGDSLR